MEVVIGPDGYVFGPADRLGKSHLLLNDYLAGSQSALAVNVGPVPAKWKKLPKLETIDLIEAILSRFSWLREHDAELHSAHLARLQLVQLLRVLYTRKLPCTETNLRMMLDLTVLLLDAIAPDGPVDYVMEYIKEYDLTPQLSHSLREFQSHLESQGSVASMQSLRQRLYTLLWMDEWEPLNPAHCWSESIRRDFRMMSGERRAGWRKLLKHIRGNAPQNMPPSWAREAEQRLAEVGIEDFCEQLSLWFAPFRSGEALPLSVAGSHILKGLIWYAALCGDERARESALWLLDVKWKQKRNIAKSMVALEVFGISKEELLSRNLIKPVSVSQPRILERLLTVLRSPMMSTHVVSDPHDDLIVVQGQLHFYRLFRSSGKIERVTDNAELELDWAAVPDQLRLSLKQQCDSDEQLGLRATLLMYDSLNQQYFKLRK